MENLTIQTEDSGDDWSLLSALSSADRLDQSSADDSEWDLVSGASYSTGNRLRPVMSYKAALLEGAPKALEGTPKDAAKVTRVANEQQRGLPAIDETNELLKDTAKPFVEKQRKKHAETGSKRFLKGRTGRRRGIWRDNDGRANLTRQNSIYLTSIEEECGGAVQSRYSNIESYNLNKKRAWEIIPTILEAESVLPPQTITRNSSDWRGRKVTTYTLKSTSETRDRDITGRPTTQIRWCDETRIYHMPAFTSSPYSSKFAPKKVFAVLDEDKPREVKGNPLTWRTRTLCNEQQCRGCLQKPVLHGNTGWYIDKAKGQTVLEIDLGKGQLVSAFSTQGGPPPIRVYPEVIHDRWRTNTWYVEGLPSDGPYHGSYWMVLDTTLYEGTKRSKLCWVRTYEVLWRAERGRKWNSLGVLTGNNDATTEKVHLFDDYRCGGIHCRYLRFVPIDCENGGALRIQAYGAPTENANQNPRIVGSGVGQEVVEYDLHHDFPMQLGSPALTPEKKWRCKCSSCSNYDWQLGSGSRRRRLTRSQFRNDEAL